MPPITRPPISRTSSNCVTAGSPTANAPASASGRRCDCLTARPRSSSSTSSAPIGIPMAAARRSLSLSMAAPGGRGRPRPMPRRPRCSPAPARITSCRILPGYRMPAAAFFRWPSRFAARSPGSTKMPHALVATASGSMSAAIPQGAHLAAVALTTDWRREFGLPADLIKGGLCSSGMYDLGPVRLSHRNSYVKFTDEMVEALSPQRHIEQLRAPLIVAYGTYETPEFQRQGRDFAAAVKAAGKPADLLVGEHYAHLELPETLFNPNGLLGAAVLEQMRLA